VVAMPVVAPWLVELFAPVAAQIVGAPQPTVAVTDALTPIAILSVALWAALAIGFAVLTALSRRHRADDTWGCGYAAPTTRMQYTGSSFSDTLEGLLPGRLRPRIAVRLEGEPFPPPGGLTSDRRDPFTRAGYEPLIDRLARRFAQLRWVQQGLLHLYLVYIVITVIGALTLVSLHDWWVRP
jgi:hydrogenase-4 component B